MHVPAWGRPLPIWKLPASGASPGSQPGSLGTGTLGRLLVLQWVAREREKSSPWSHHHQRGVGSEQGLIFEGEAGHRSSSRQKLWASPLSEMCDFHQEPRSQELLFTTPGTESAVVGFQDKW